MKSAHQVGSYEAKTHLPKLLYQVAKGDRIMITRHGIPVAMLIPIQAEKATPESSIEQLVAFAWNHPLRGESIRHMIDEGRRF